GFPRGPPDLDPRTPYGALVVLVKTLFGRTRLASLAVYWSVAKPVPAARAVERIVYCTQPFTAVCGDDVTWVVAPPLTVFASEMTSVEPVPEVMVLPAESATQIVAVVVETPSAGSGFAAEAGGLFDSVS